VGTWSLGQRHGGGRHKLAEEVYEGSFHAGHRSGVGTLTASDGSTYSGEWRDGWQHGTGTYVSASGERYVGAYVCGERSGRGKAVYANGDTYDGQWRHGRREGRGHMTYISQPPPANPPGFTPRGPPSPLRVPGEKSPTRLLTREALGPAPAAAPLQLPPTYEGEWRDDERSGTGKSISYGEVYEGDWLQGKRHGRGTCFYPDGECYVGDWVHGRRQGGGSLANGP